ISDCTCRASVEFAESGRTTEGRVDLSLAAKTSTGVAGAGRAHQSFGLHRLGGSPVPTRRLGGRARRGEPRRRIHARRRNRTIRPVGRALLSLFIASSYWLLM